MTLSVLTTRVVALNLKKELSLHAMEELKRKSWIPYMGFSEKIATPPISAMAR
jgi:hypothetical protein